MTRIDELKARVASTKQTIATLTADLRSLESRVKEQKRKIAFNVETVENDQKEIKGLTKPK